MAKRGTLAEYNADEFLLARGFIPTGYSRRQMPSAVATVPQFTSPVPRSAWPTPGEVGAAAASFGPLGSIMDVAVQRETGLNVTPVAGLSSLKGDSWRPYVEGAAAGADRVLGVPVVSATVVGSDPGLRVAGAYIDETYERVAARDGVAKAERVKAVQQGIYGGAAGGFAAGALAGSTVFPGVGTLLGGIAGMYLGALPAAVGAAAI